MSAIVLDGHLKSALSAVRSLGRKGVPVVVGGTRGNIMSAHSRYALRSFVYVSPTDDPRSFFSQVLSEAKKMHEKTGERPVILAFSDATSLILAREYEKLEQYAVMPLPHLASFELASDKLRTYERARELSIPTIRTYEEHEFDQVTYPAVVKHRHSIVFKEDGAITGSAEFVFSKEEMKKRFSTIMERSGEAPLVMEFVKGSEYGVEMIAEEGRVLCAFVHVRIRSLSPRGGAAVVKETAAENEETALMRQYAAALVESLSWTGPIMIEFKIDARDGRVVLMEINGRFWGSLPLAIHAGVDFPYLTYTLANGKIFDLRSRTSKKARTRHFLGDCKWLLQVLFSRDPMRKHLYPPRFRALWEFKTEMFKSTGDVFWWSDPIPAVYEYIDIITKWRSKA